MRLLNIAFKNIHSLKGEHRVHFNQEPLLSSGIFAITGATGSGKSSLLDVITLALYNKIPRFDSKISRAEIDKMGSVVTHHTDEAWAEVTYETNNGAFRSRWEISRARTGNWRDYEMTISNLASNRAIDVRKSEVPAKNEELIGLNYEQFVKSILLSQGEFARFLKSGKHERSKLLEDITGTHIYREIGAKAFELLKEKNQVLEHARTRLDAIALLGEEELLSIKSERTNLKNTLDEKVNQVDKIRKDKDTKSLIMQIISDEEELKKDKETLQANETKFEKDKQRREVHQSLMVHVPDIEKLKSTQEELESTVTQKVKCERDLLEGTTSLNSAKQELSQVTGVEIQASNFIQELTSFKKEINNYDAQLNLWVSKGIDIRGRISKILKSNDRVFHVSLTDRIDPLEAQQLIRKRLSEIGSVGEFQLKEYRQQKDLLMNECQSLKEWRRVGQELTNTADQLEIFAKAIVDFQNDLKDHSSNQATLNKDLTRIIKDLEFKEKQHQRALREASLEEHRNQLVEGEPCPLCGSEHHPYSLHKVFIELGKANLDVENLKKQKSKTENEINALSGNIGITKVKIENLAKESAQRNLAFAALRKEADLLIREHAFLAQIQLENISKELDLRNKQIVDLEMKMQNHAEAQVLQQLQEEYKELKDVLDKYTVLNDQRRARYIGEDVNVDGDIIQKKYTEADSKIKSCELLLKNITARISSLVKLNDELSVKLNTALIELGFSGIESAKSALLTPAELALISQEETTLVALKASIVARTSELLKKKELLKDTPIPEYSMEELNNRLDESNNAIHLVNKQLGGLEERLKTDESNRKSHFAIQQQLEVLLLKNRKYELLNGLIGDAKGAGFSNYAQELTLERLLALTNVRLKDMNDRYLLKHELDGDDLLVIDQYQGNTQRAVKTLSGGESFIISLALALSLSDLASRNVRLESLFIDEGFGTLDPETLDIALTTLEKLRNDSGKTIGIISHVSSLKERILTQIQVIKNAQGYSALEVVG